MIGWFLHEALNFFLRHPFPDTCTNVPEVSELGVLHVSSNVKENVRRRIHNVSAVDLIYLSIVEQAPLAVNVRLERRHVVTSRESALMMYDGVQIIQHGTTRATSIARVGHRIVVVVLH